MAKKILVLCGCCIMLLVSQKSWGLSGRGTTAASFLKIGIGARAVAMGESFVAVANDASAVYWNPAGLAKLSFPEIMAMHVFWFQNIYFEQLAATLPMPTGTLAGSLIYLNDGTLARSNVGDTPESPERGLFSASDFGITTAYGYPFSKTLSLGASLVLFSENIDSQANLGWAMNIGFLYLLPWDGWSLGAQIQNLGPATHIQDEYFRLPINFKLGLSYFPYPELALAMDYNQLLEQGGKISFGLEYFLEKSLALRVGYAYQEKIDTSELFSDYGNTFISGITAGLGFIYKEFRFDYAFVPYGFLGSTHRIAITYQFPK